MGIVEDRRELHQIPELHKDLKKTFAYLENALAGLPCRVFSPAEGGLCAWFDFGRERAIAFRSDADALPIAERTGAAYASRHPGAMHACGHDGHMAMALELARRLSRGRDWGHNVLLVFQGAEETTGGARDICESGVFQQYRVEAIFGMHLWPGLPAGTVASRPGGLMARSSEVTLDVYGKSAHIARSWEGVDALAAGAELYRRAMDLAESYPGDAFRLLKFGKMESGTVRNALSAHTHLEGSLRAFEDGVFEGIRSGIRDLAAQVAQEYGCAVEATLTDGYPAVYNPAALYDRVRALAPFQELEAPSLTTEDFAFYQKHLPGLFFFLGIGDTPALHADTFDFDEAALTKGADFLEALAERF